MYPMVSIIIPTLKRPKYLEITLKSILAQTYQNLEIIVSDNGSQDDTREVVKRIFPDDKRVKFRENPFTVPLNIHINQCLENITGRYLFILSDDDLISSNFIEEFVTLFENNEKISVGIAHNKIIDEYGNITQDIEVPDWNQINGVTFALNWLFGEGLVPCYTFFSIFIRSKIMKEIGGFPQFDGGNNSDNCIFLFSAIKGNVAISKNAIFYYRIYLSSYGLSTPYKSLAKSSSDFRYFIVKNSNFRTALAALDKHSKRRIIKGVKAMLARQYLGRIMGVYSKTINSKIELIYAIIIYKPDLEYITTLVRFWSANALLNLKKTNKVGICDEFDCK